MTVSKLDPVVVLIVVEPNRVMGQVPTVTCTVVRRKRRVTAERLEKPGRFKQREFCIEQVDDWRLVRGPIEIHEVAKQSRANEYA